MIFKLALVVIMSILSETNAAEIKASGDGKERISHLRAVKKVQADASIAIKDDDVSTDFSNQRFLERHRRGKASKKDRDPIEPSVTALPPCGNGNCDPGETYLLCPKDCAPTHDPIKPSDDDYDEEWEEDSDEPWCHGTFEVIARSKNSVKVCAPSKSQVGDFLFLFISSSGGRLPQSIDGWNRGTECFKSRNKQATCSHTDGDDLGTVMYYRQFSNSDDCWDVKINGGTTWAIMTAITNVNEQNPLGDIAEVSCDRTEKSKFPSVTGGVHDVVLFSQGFDDAYGPNDFKPTGGVSRLAYMKVHEDAGFLMAKELNRSGPTGSLVTEGKGGETCKDVLLSIVVNRLSD